MIPMKYDEEGNLEEIDAYNPFMRGIMEFDDYNYTVHNPYVLVEDPKFADADDTPNAGSSPATVKAVEAKAITSLAV